MPIVLTFTALLFCGCARMPSAATLSRLAVARSNQEAKRLYHVEPFKEEHGQWRSEGQQRIWEALTSTGGHDMTGKVTFDQRGSVTGVYVRMLAHPSPEPSPNLSPLGPNIPREKRFGIPEVMPK